MKVFIYCQHVWGLGHLFRMLEIVRALESHEVLLVTGGPAVALPLPPHVRRFQLPALRMQADKQLVAEDGRALETVWAERLAMLQACFRAEAPDVFIVELYPFGRTAFGRELDPLLAAIRSGQLPRCRVYCSVRDILVAKRDPRAYEARVVRRLNRWFDGLLVHADPALVRLDTTFSTLAAVEIPVAYTGYVAPSVGPGTCRADLRRQFNLRADEKLIVVSAGGGRSGYPLLAAALAARQALSTRMRVRMALFTGPYLPESNLAALRAVAVADVKVRRFTTDFADWLTAADLSLSMAGYNTCMRLLTTGVPALVWPFEGDREQPLRAARLAAKGWLSVLTTPDLETGPLSARIETALQKTAGSGIGIDLQGASNTARYIEKPLPGGQAGAA